MIDVLKDINNEEFQIFNITKLVNEIYSEYKKTKNNKKWATKLSIQLKKIPYWKYPERFFAQFLNFSYKYFQKNINKNAKVIIFHLRKVESQVDQEVPIFVKNYGKIYDGISKNIEEIIGNKKYVKHIFYQTKKELQSIIVKNLREINLNLAGEGIKKIIDTYWKKD